MTIWVSVRWQTALILVLFLGSLAVLVFNTWTTLELPQGELRVRDALRQASRRMVEAAAEQVGPAQGHRALPRHTLDRRLHAITAEALEHFSNIEGGFY